MINQKERWKIMDRVVLLSISLIAFFAWMDIKQIHPFHVISQQFDHVQVWELYAKYTGPAVYVSWIVMLVVIAITWYLIFKDKSEAVGIFAVPAILLAGGWEDILFYMFKGINFFGETMPWLENSWFMNLVANLMGAPTVTSSTLMASAGLSVIIAYFVYGYLKKAKW